MPDVLDVVGGCPQLRIGRIATEERGGLLDPFGFGFAGGVDELRVSLHACQHLLVGGAGFQVGVVGTLGVLPALTAAPLRVGCTDFGKATDHRVGGFLFACSLLRAVSLNLLFFWFMVSG